MKRFGMTPYEWEREKRRFGYALRMTAWSALGTAVFIGLLFLISWCLR